ncbi:MAG: DUF3147 family protein [Desulfuromonadales bacterium]|nr:DUF3147 family protein [Desulfuromonadales bacterium]
MTYYLIKIAVTSALIVAISEISKRSSFVGALLASLPIISVFAILWLYIDTKDITKVSVLSTNIFWLVLPSLVLFITLPLLLKHGHNFYVSICISACATVCCYWLMVSILNHFGAKL